MTAVAEPRDKTTLNRLDRRVLKFLADHDIGNLWDRYGYPSFRAREVIAAGLGEDETDCYSSMKHLKALKLLLNSFDIISGYVDQEALASLQKNGPPVGGIFSLRDCMLARAEGKEPQPIPLEPIEKTPASRLIYEAIDRFNRRLKEMDLNPFVFLRDREIEPITQDELLRAVGPLVWGLKALAIVHDAYWNAVFEKEQRKRNPAWKPKDAAKSTMNWRRDNGYINKVKTSVAMLHETVSQKEKPNLYDLSLIQSALVKDMKNIEHLADVCLESLRNDHVAPPANAELRALLTKERIQDAQGN